METMTHIFASVLMPVLVLVGSLNGTAFQFVWPRSPSVQNQIMLLSVPLAVLFTASSVSSVQ